MSWKVINSWEFKFATLYVHDIEGLHNWLTVMCMYACPKYNLTLFILNYLQISKNLLVTRRKLDDTKGMPVSQGGWKCLFIINHYTLIFKKKNLVCETMREGKTPGRKRNRRNRNEEYNYVKTAFWTLVIVVAPLTEMGKTPLKAKKAPWYCPYLTNI